MSIRTLNKQLEEKGLSDTKEVTRYKGKYYLLHICANGVPVPLNLSKNIQDIKDAIDLLEA